MKITTLRLTVAAVMREGGWQQSAWIQEKNFMWRGGSRECTLLEGDFRMLLRGRITIVVYKRTGWEE